MPLPSSWMTSFVIAGARSVRSAIERATKSAMRRLLRSKMMFPASRRAICSMDKISRSMRFRVAPIFAENVLTVWTLSGFVGQYLLIHHKRCQRRFKADGKYLRWYFSEKFWSGLPPHSWTAGLWRAVPRRKRAEKLSLLILRQMAGKIPVCIITHDPLRIQVQPSAPGEKEKGCKKKKKYHADGSKCPEKETVREKMV